jgi:hypothetical protein
MLNTEPEIKKYIHKVLAGGNKDQIQKVLKRYFAWKKEHKTDTPETSQEDTAKDIFGVI